jgi:hypothetical protein
MRTRKWLLSALLVSCVPPSNSPPPQYGYGPPPAQPQQPPPYQDPAQPPPAQPYQPPAQPYQPPAQPYQPPTTYQPPAPTYQPPVAEPAYQPPIGPTYVDVAVDPEGSEVPSVDVFYDELQPYGSFYDDPSYGWVFAPSQASYVPYSNGYWKNTDYGFSWVSNDPFGWATDHYGRWVWVNRWVWRPDTTWGPAWVQWRVGDGWVGWAPMGVTDDACAARSGSSGSTAIARRRGSRARMTSGCAASASRRAVIGSS